MFFVRLAAGGYEVAGKSYFDDIVFSDFTQALAADGFEDFIEASPSNVWRIRVKVPDEKINAVVDMVHFGADSDLVHYTGPDSIENLLLSCEYKVVKPGECYLSSNYYSSYWHTVHLKKLTTSLVWSDEKLDLTSAGAKTAKMPFQKRFSSYFDPVSKGENCVRGHHYFCIYDQNGKVIGQTKSVNALVHP